MKKEILIVTFNWKNIGGTQKRAALLKEKFSKKYNIEHIFINSYIRFNILKLDKLITNIRNFFKYRNKLKKYKVVIAFSNLPSIFSLISKCTLITVISGSTYYYKEASFISKVYWIFLLEPLIYLFAKKIIPAAPHLVPFYIKKTFLHKKVDYINGFIELNELRQKISSENNKIYKFSKINLENCICLSSSLISHKGIIEFLEIYLEYRNKLRNDYLKLIIIGDGPKLKDCLEYCRNNSLVYQTKSEVFNNNTDLYFTGHLDKPIFIIQQCSLFVMPSFYEGLSNQLLEAIYTGIPIIASNCPGNNFIYSEIGKERKDYLNSNFFKLMPVIKNRKIKSSWAKELIFYTKNFKSVKYKNSHKLIDNFSSEKNFAKWEIIVKNIMNEKK